MKKIIPLLSVFMLLFMACPPKDGEEVAITLSPTTLELKVGETGALTASVTPAQAKIAGVKWSSSDSAVASVSSGTVTGVGEGTATITAESVQDPSKKASASVTVTNPYKDGFTISGDDFYNVNPMQTEVRFMLFNETDRFLNMVKECFPAAESAGFKYSDIIVKNIDAAENSLVLLTDPPLFVLGSPLSADSFAVEKTAAVEPATEYTKKFALDLEAGGRTVKVTWLDGEGDVFTTPNEGEITFSASDVVYSVSEERKISGTVNNLATKLTAAGVTVDSGTVAVKITVGDQSETTTAAVPTDSIAWNIDHAFDEGASLSLTVELIFNGYNPAPVVAYQGFPVELTVQKSVVITPLEISLNRKTSTRGVPEAKLIAQFSYPDMEVLLDGADYLNGTYADYDFENATWSARFADADSAGTAVATFENAPYGEPAETGLDLSKEYKLKLMDGTLTVPAKTGGSVSFPLTWSSDALLGDSILIKHEAEFPEKLYFNASDNFTPRTEKKDGDTEYILVFGDDFNYTYNGLNYKSYAEWNEAKRSGDTKGITEFSRIWTTENENNAFTRRQATWDMRSAEVKNSHLFQKNMAADPSSGKIYLGANETKPLKGFTDLNQAGPVPEGTTRAGEVLTGSVISDYVTYGYMTARVRTKANGYVSSSAVRGPWYAFWAHGPMHEFDIMEQLATNPLQFCNVNHYHNNWGGYGKDQNDQVNSVFYNTITMTNSDIKQNHWTLGLFWNQNNYAYYYNDQPYTVISTSNQVTATRRMLPITGASVTKNASEQMSVNLGNADTSYSDHGYTGTLKAVPSAPVNIFVSTEAGGSWGGGDLNLTIKRQLPTWLEVDYVAYYLPNVEVSAVTIPQEQKDKYTTVFATTPSFTLTAEVTPNDVPTKDVIWSSDNPQAVEISADGTVTIVGSGTATIKAVSVMDETKSDSFTITVSNDKVSVDSVAIEGNDAIDLDYMGTTTLTVTISPDNASVKNVEWTVAPEGIVELENADTETVTVNAVGSGTVIENIQCSFVKDDSFEWFGGTVNCKNLVAFRGWDDDFDTDAGFRGSVQFAVALRDKAVSDKSKSNGFESDNDADGSDNAPLNNPRFSNVSIFGPFATLADTSFVGEAYASDAAYGPYQAAMHLRRNTRLQVYNSVFAGYPVGLYIDSDKCMNSAEAGIQNKENNLVVKNCVLAGMQVNFRESVESASLTTEAYFTNAALNNKTVATNAELGIEGVFNYTKPSFLPAGNSELLGGADFSGLDAYGFETVAFRGAFGTEDWTEGWCNFDPQNTGY